MNSIFELLNQGRKLYRDNQLCAEDIKVVLEYNGESADFRLYVEGQIVRHLYDSDINRAVERFSELMLGWVLEIKEELTDER